MLRRSLKLLQSLRDLVRNARRQQELTRELQASLEKQADLATAIQRYELLLKAEASRGLTIDDFSFSKLEDAELRTSSAVMRMSLFKACEIVRLCEPDVGSPRVAIERLRNHMLDITRAPHNLLPHEETPANSSPIAKKDRSPLLPRHDLF